MDFGQEKIIIHEYLEGKMIDNYHKRVKQKLKELGTNLHAWLETNLQVASLSLFNLTRQEKLKPRT